MKGTVNPPSGGGEPNHEPHGEGILPSEVRSARDRAPSADRVYLLLREAGEPLTYGDLAERYSVAELRSRYEDRRQRRRERQHEQTEPDVQSGGGPSPAVASLAAPEREEVAELREQFAELADADRRLAEHRRAEIADRIEDLTGSRPETDD